MPIYKIITSFGRTIGSFIEQKKRGRKKKNDKILSDFNIQGGEVILGKIFKNGIVSIIVQDTDNLAYEYVIGTYSCCFQGNVIGFKPYFSNSQWIIEHCQIYPPQKAVYPNEFASIVEKKPVVKQV